MVVKIDFEQISYAVKSSVSMAEAASKVNLHFSTFKKYAKKLGVYMPNPGRKGISKPKKEGAGKIPLDEILSGLHPQYQTYKLKHRLYDAGIKSNQCENCNTNSWNGQILECELDHVDGNRTNHKLENLKILCPNCHSQTSTFRFKRGRGEIGKPNALKMRR